MLNTLLLPAISAFELAIQKLIDDYPENSEILDQYLGNIRKLSIDLIERLEMRK